MSRFGVLARAQVEHYAIVVKGPQCTGVRRDHLRGYSRGEECYKELRWTNRKQSQEEDYL